jgi:steroid delta-isomerase-like uncharacterized protein
MTSLAVRAPAEADRRSVEENRAAVRRMFDEVFARGETGVFIELLAPDVVFHLAGYPEPLRGKEAVKRWADEYLAAFAVRLSVHSIVAEGDDVAARWTMVATHRGEYAGIPRTGRQVAFDALEWMHFRDGKVVEIWNRFDALDVVQQLGALPRGRPPKALLRLLIGLRSIRSPFSR